LYLLVSGFTGGERSFSHCPADALTTLIRNSYKEGCSSLVVRIRGQKSLQGFSPGGVEAVG